MHSPVRRLADPQASLDDRSLAIDKVGIKALRYPITLLCEDGHDTPQSTVAEISMSVSLASNAKGTHMSRFLEVLHEHHEAISLGTLGQFAQAIKERLRTPEVHLELRFPYFVQRDAPVTNRSGKLDIETTLAVTSNATTDLVLGIRVPATSLCPCSKEISQHGAHNQRSEMSAKVRCRDGQQLSIEELFSLIDNCGSAQIFPVLKRPDEKWVTERAYENPKFAEDIVRDIALVLGDDDRITWFECSVENFESIHNHNAFVCISRDKQAAGVHDG